MPKGKGTIYDVLIHVMITYGAFTFAIEDMLKDIKEKSDVLRDEISNNTRDRFASPRVLNLNSRARSSRPSGHAASSSSHKVSDEQRDEIDATEKSIREIAEEGAKRVFEKCGVVKLEEHDDGSRVRKPSREIKEDREKMTHAKCETDFRISQVGVVEEGEATRKRSPIRRWNRVRKRTRSIGSQASEASHASMPELIPITPRAKSLEAPQPRRSKAIPR